MLYQISKGTKSFGAQQVFENIRFEVKGVEKIAIVGRNGSGKSTLLKCIVGELELDQGVIHKANGLRIGYLSQTTFDDETLSVQEEMNLIFKDVFECEAELKKIAEQMKEDHSDKILERYAETQVRFELLNGYNIQDELLSLFTRFGFTKEDLNREIRSFSGGQRTRIAFVKLLLSKPDILLLDEPTNHLDLETIEWLEGYLKRYEKAIISVSHDRTFLDAVSDVTYELEYGELKRYSGNYTFFMEQKKKDQERQAQAYSRQQKEIERLEALIEKFRYKKNKASFAQSKIKYLDRMDKVDKVCTSDTKSFHSNFTPKTKGGKHVLSVSELEVGYDHVLTYVSLEILAGQRVAVMGTNGVGKSTLLKTLVGQMPALSGEMLFGHQIEVGFFDQQVAQLSSQKTVLEEIWDDYPELDRTEIRSVLGRFLFSADDVFKSVNVLSGGERVRLALSKLMLQRPNFLILDEPTNHLDIVGREALEESLKGYTGTILFVSHDRYFIKKIANSILLLNQGKSQFFPDGYQQYLGVVVEAEEKRIDVAKEEIKVTRIEKINAERRIKKLEGLIQEMEEKLEDHRSLRFEPEYYHDHLKMQELDLEIDEIHTEIDKLMREWEELSNLV
ncbi:MAG: ABC-F family ATP-binding cassette domain-containing protein [Anaerorhabdus sp.]